MCDAAFGPSVVMGWMSALSQNWSYLLALEPGAGWWRLGAAQPCRQRCRAAHAAPPSCQAALCAQVARSVVPSVLPSGLAASSNTSSSPEPGSACLPASHQCPAMPADAALTAAVLVIFTDLLQWEALQGFMGMGM